MSKVKMKIRKSLSKRFRLTKKGKVLFRGSHMRHLKRKKSKRSIRRQNVPHLLTNTWKNKVKKLL